MQTHVDGVAHLPRNSELSQVYDFCGPSRAAEKAEEKGGRRGRLSAHLERFGNSSPERRRGCFQRSFYSPPAPSLQAVRGRSQGCDALDRFPCASGGEIAEPGGRLGASAGSAMRRQKRNVWGFFSSSSSSSSSSRSLSLSPRKPGKYHTPLRQRRSDNAEDRCREIDEQDRGKEEGLGRDSRLKRKPSASTLALLSQKK